MQLGYSNEETQSSENMFQIGMETAEKFYRFLFVDFSEKNLWMETEYILKFYLNCILWLCNL